MRIPALIAALALAANAAAADISVNIVWIERQAAERPTLANLDPLPEDLGRAGARLGLVDNASTGKFLKHAYELAEIIVPEDGDMSGAALEALREGARLLVVKGAAADLLAIADLPEAEGALIFNVGSPAPALRSADCRANLFHTLPSLDMRTDALMQFLVRKKWTDLAMVMGKTPEDQAFAGALRNSATKFGLRIRDELIFDSSADLRRSAGQELPLLLQDLPDHDVLLVADEWGDFGPFVLWNTWTPRPVAGSEGLVPVAWDGVIEAWGAAQLQNRFRELAGRRMQSVDYAAWAAIRTIGEAVTRTGTAEADVLRRYILSEEFGLAAHKGNKLSYRDWNGQLRQPIALVQPRALVATAPFEGFLHQRTELDTLGLDEPESACTAFR
ncbi:MAG TPA: ABC transporter substrate-binding protein [Paracoccaceae bacterium]|nr:ABC transporter substrate-binding protein [Paracoccaceae bacterium]